MQGVRAVRLVALALGAACGALEAPAQSAPVLVPPVEIRGFPQPKPFANRPPVPVRMLPQAVVEPPRTVPAREWHSPYCTEWSDGVDLCTRESADQPGQCRAVAAIAPHLPPERQHPVACLSADLMRLEAVCRRWALMDPGLPIPYWQNRVRKTRSAGALVQENWIWVRKSEIWENFPGHDDAIDNMPPSFVAKNGISDNIANIRTFYCFKSYTPDIPWARAMRNRIDDLKRFGRY